MTKKYPFLSAPSPLKAIKPEEIHEGVYVPTGDLTEWQKRLKRQGTAS